jgi:exonuclease SbcC
MRAFGAYADEQVIDFAELGSHKLFLIHGPTGSGKTTILDGICFALFGESSGEKRQASHMRSKRAGISRPTEVEFDFALGAKRYRVRRSPEQIRPRLRGEGHSVSQHEATLWALHGSEAVVIRERKPSQVDAEIRNLLCYTSDEFRQVVMLPQGRFRELLEASPDDRQAILRKLFGTAFYERVQELLKKEALAARVACDEINRERKMLFEEINVSDLSAAESIREGLADKLADIRIRCDVAAEFSSKLRRKEEDGRQIVRALNSVNDAREVLSFLMRDIDLQSARKVKLLAARKADRMSGPEERWRSAVRLADRSAAEAKSAAQRAASAVALRKSLQERLGDEVARSALVSELEHTARVAADILPKLRDLDRASKRLAAARHAYSAGTKRQKDAEAELSEVEASDVELRESKARIEKVAGTADSARLAYENEVRIAKDCNDLNKAASDRSSSEKAVASIELRLASEMALYESAKSQRRNAEIAFRSTVSASLSASLQDGEPCSVCGSLDHPKPALQVCSEAVVSLEDLEAAEIAAQERTSSTGTLLASVRATLAAKNERVRLLEDRLAEHMSLSQAEMKARVERSERLKEEAYEAVKLLPKLASDIADSSFRLAGIRKTIASQSEVLVGLMEEGANARADYDRLKSEIPAESLDIQTAEKNSADANAKAQLASRSLADDREAAAAAHAAAEEASRAARSHLEASSQADSERDAETEDFRAACLAGGFETLEACISARVSAEALAELESEVHDFEHRKSAAEANLETAEKAASGLQMPDMKSLSEDALTAENNHQALIQQKAVAFSELEHIGSLVSRLVAAEARLEEAGRVYSVREHLSRLAFGSNASKEDYEGYVLGRHLDAALAAANLRLREMMGGRFKLIRALQRESKVGKAGLDLRIVDSWSGTEGPVAQLSGGEGFCASLALALGTADTVKSYAGGVDIEALFIDEGFGTLDEDTLETAMKVLGDLKGGDRLVGVISHVTEMRRIPARLTVSLGARTSTAEFNFC